MIPLNDGHRGPSLRCSTSTIRSYLERPARYDFSGFCGGVVWWDGAATLRGGAFQVGVGMTSVTGQVACCGRHDGQRLEVALGNVLLREASVLGVRKLNELMAREKRVSATAIQTVGIKGYDGFAVALVLE